MRHLHLILCSAAAFAALDVSHTRAQDEPTEVVAVATDIEEPQPWQLQLEELREQVAALRQELDELKARHTPDAVLEIKRLDEKLDLLQSVLSKPDAPTKADLDSLREFLSLQDDLVERHAAGEIKRVDEKIGSLRETLVDRMNIYAWAIGITVAALIATVSIFVYKTVSKGP